MSGQRARGQEVQWNVVCLHRWLPVQKQRAVRHHSLYMMFYPYPASRGKAKVRNDVVVTLSICACCLNAIDDERKTDLHLARDARRGVVYGLVVDHEDSGSG